MRIARTSALIISTILIILYVIVPHQTALSYGLTETSSLLTRLTYFAMHDNPIHLIVNIYCLLSLTFLSGARLQHIIVAVLISTTLPHVLTDAIPIIGISVANSALCGIVICRSKKMFFFTFFNTALILLGAFFANIAVRAHLYGLYIGLLYGLLTTPRYE